MTTPQVDPSNPLCGTWCAFEGDTNDYCRSEYTIRVEDGRFQVSAVDCSDGEEFEISDVTWNGVTLGFHSYVPSTARCGINQMRYVGDGKMEFLFTFTEREIWFRFEPIAPTNQAEQAVSSDGHESSNPVPSTPTTAPADAH